MTPHEPQPEPGQTRYDETAPEPAATDYGSALDAVGTNNSTPALDAGVTNYESTSESVGAAPRLTLPCRFGNYELLEEIGRGGMGVVFKARQQSPERLVALKMILGGLLSSEDDARRFRQEADQAASLDHPHIVPIYEFGAVGGQHFFSMKLVEGGTLNQHLGRFRDDFRATARLLVTVARAIHHAHQRQLLHRDLKPGNILLDAHGQPHVADFGLAKRLGARGEVMVSVALAGTPEFMAPEQAAEKQALTTAADVYALGAILYALLTGQPPFRGASVVETLQKVVEQEPVSPRARNPRVPRDLETICLKCLRKKPEERYGSAEAMAEELERWLRGEAVAARPVGRLERAWRWCKRNSAVAGLLTAFVVALLAGTIVSVFFAVEADRRADDAHEKGQKATEAFQVAQERERQIGAARRKLQVTLARSLLRPIGHQTKTQFVLIAAPEVDALWDLASESDEEVRRLFIEQALEQPGTTRQLSNRADLALHAVIGLNRERRKVVEGLLAARLRDAQSTAATREDCLFMVLAFQDWGPECAGTAVRVALDAMTKPTNLHALSFLTEVVASLAVRMETQQASAAAHQTLAAMKKTTNVYTLICLGWAVASLTARMEPQQGSRVAADAAHQVLDAVTKTDNPLKLSSLTWAVASLAARMEPQQAGRVAAEAGHKALDAMNKTKSADHLYYLAEAVASLAARMEPQQAARVAAEVVRKALDTRPPNGFPAGPASRYYKPLPPSTFYQGGMVKAVASLAGRVEPLQADVAVQKALDAMSKTNGGINSEYLARVVASLAARMEPQQADAAARKALDAFKSTSVPASFSLLKTVGSLAARMEPQQASRVAAEACHKVLDTLTDNNAPRLGSLAVEVVAALAGRMEPKQASEAARKALDTMTKTTNEYVLGYRAEMVAALAGRMEPEQAAQVAGQAAQLTLDRVTKTTNVYPVPHLWRAVSSLVARMEPQRARSAAQKVLNVMTDPNGDGDLVDLERLAIVLHLQLSSEAMTQRAGSLSLSLAGSPSAPLASLVPLTAASQPLPGRFSEQVLVDFLKRPTCPRPARQILVKQLGEQCGQRFANQWEFVEWARKHRPNLDLTSPPKRQATP